jgi:hypothetical protein
MNVIPETRRAHYIRLIDWLVFNANFSNISAILWRALN